MEFWFPENLNQPFEWRIRILTHIIRLIFINFGMWMDVKWAIIQIFRHNCAFLCKYVNIQASYVHLEGKKIPFSLYSPILMVVAAILSSSTRKMIQLVKTFPWCWCFTLYSSCRRMIQNSILQCGTTLTKSFIFHMMAIWMKAFLCLRWFFYFFTSNISFILCVNLLLRKFYIDYNWN